MPSTAPSLASIPADWLPAGVDPATARIAGADEVGRGSGAGLFLAACVEIPLGVVVPANLADSKRFNPRGATLAALAAWVEDNCRVHSVSYSVEQIDEMGIGRVNVEAFERLIEMAGVDLVIVDGNLRLHSKLAFRCVTKAERFSPVAAASIWAKRTRDRAMNEVAAQHPGY